jgi:hypothetical protein
MNPSFVEVIPVPYYAMTNCVSPSILGAGITRVWESRRLATGFDFPISLLVARENLRQIASKSPKESTEFDRSSRFDLMEKID